MFIPHGHCYLWRPGLVWGFLASDLTIALAYFSIPLSIWRLIHSIKASLPKNLQPVFYLFQVFILACGAGHVIKIVEIWHPVYWLHLAENVVTAGVSAWTAISLLPIAAQAIAFVDTAETNHEKLLRSQKQIELFLDQSPIAIYIKDTQSRLQYYNQQIRTLWGVKDEWLGLTDDQFLVDKEEALKILQNDRLVLQSGKRMEFIEYARTPDNESREWLSFKFPFADPITSEIFLGGVSVDITKRREAQVALQKANEQMESAMQELECKNAEITTVSEIADALHSCQSSEEVHQVIEVAANLLFEGMSGEVYTIANSRNYAETQTHWGTETSQPVFAPDQCWALRRGSRVNLLQEVGKGLLCQHLVKPIQGSHLCIPMSGQGEILGVLHLHSPTPISETQQRIAEIIAQHLSLALGNLFLRSHLQEQSIRDPLTRLFNRRYAEEWSSQQLAQCRRERQPFAVVLLDLDRFKLLNDTYGHEAGDIALKEISLYLSQAIRRGDLICRWGGEELLILMPRASLKEAATRAEELRQGIKRLSIKQDGRVLGVVTASFGTSAFPEHGETLSELTGQADKALYQAKQDGRDRVVAASSQANSQIDWMTRILAALDPDDSSAGFTLYCQRITCLTEEQSQYFAEVLLRMVEDGRVVEGGASFLEHVCLDPDVMRRIDRWVVAEVASLCQADCASRYAVNLNPASVADSEFVDFAIATLSGVSQRICFEITERQALNIAASRDNIAKLRAEGFKVGLDDLKTNYLSRKYLQELPLDFIKLERPESDEVVKQFFAIAAEYGVDAVVEFVESPAIAARLKEIRDEHAPSLRLFAQGYGMPDGVPRNCRQE